MDGVRDRRRHIQALTGVSVLSSSARRSSDNTEVGRALARLGIEHILAYSPAARGRSEGFNRTRQDRLVNEWRVAGITTVAAAETLVGYSCSRGYL